MALQFGIKEIDDQHAEITRLVDGMTDSIKLRKSILDVHYRIVRLQDVVGHHFTFEESLMRLFRYPRQDAHVALHANILSKLDELKKLSLRTGEIDWSELDVKGTLLSHMDEHDRDLCKFILDTTNCGIGHVAAIQTS